MVMEVVVWGGDRADGDRSSSVDGDRGGGAREKKIMPI